MRRMFTKKEIENIAEGAQPSFEKKYLYIVNYVEFIDDSDVSLELSQFLFFSNVFVPPEDISLDTFKTLSEFGLRVAVYDENNDSTHLGYFYKIGSALKLNIINGDEHTIDEIDSMEMECINLESGEFKFYEV